MKYTLSTLTSVAAGLVCTSACSILHGSRATPIPHSPPVAATTEATIEATSPTTGRIIGIVNDRYTGMLAEGVIVAATRSAGKSHDQSAMIVSETDQYGRFQIDALPPGVYTIEIAFGKRRIWRTGIIVTPHTTTPVRLVEDLAYLANAKLPPAYARQLAMRREPAREPSLENNYVVDGINTGSLCGAMAPSLLLNYDDSLSTACFHQEFACVPADPYSLSNLQPTFGTTLIQRFYPSAGHRQR